MSLEEWSPSSRPPGAGHRATCSELCWNSGQSPVKPWFKDTTTRRSPFSCSDCGRNFSYPSLLTTHRQVHSGSGPSPVTSARPVSPSASTCSSISSSTQGKSPTRALWATFPPEGLPGHPQTGSHQGEALSMPKLQKSLHLPLPASHPPAQTHRREALQLSQLRPLFRLQLPAGHPQAHPYRQEALPLSRLWPPVHILLSPPQSPAHSL